MVFGRNHRYFSIEGNPIRVGKGGEPLSSEFRVLTQLRTHDLNLRHLVKLE